MYTYVHAFGEKWAKVSQVREKQFLTCWESFVSLFYLMEYRERVTSTILIDGGHQ